MAELGLLRIQPLNEINHSTWSQEMHALLRGKGLWRLISEQEKRHGSDKEKQNNWDDKADCACGILMPGVELPQCTLFQAVSNNPTKIWTTVESAYICPKRTSTQFNAYNFLMIRNTENKSLQALVLFRCLVLNGQVLGIQEWFGHWLQLVHCLSISIGAKFWTLGVSPRLALRRRV